MSAVTSPTAWIDAAPSQWTLAPLGTHFDERSETVSDAEFQPLSVTRNGVVPQLEHVRRQTLTLIASSFAQAYFAINSRPHRKGQSAGLSEFDGSVSVVYTV
jgi:type I restriction enzyme S subunit